MAKSSSASSTITMVAAIASVVAGSLIIVTAVIVQKIRARPYDFADSLKELSTHLKGPEGLVKPREIRRDAVRLLQVISGDFRGLGRGALFAIKVLTIVICPNFYIDFGIR